ncbi:proto-oncogene serine/threonine-protein kinase mos [Wyeomyia smithii]|uniref:proto-oncogene serine/threonine-protein kinase mos n=1 Tax=Wyeomyia smithii TaxID=174621 RepID=UPI002467F930|nr:proto-oncogene serine/threonine-protein kinase mos [Wyeomyia smithii]
MAPSKLTVPKLEINFDTPNRDRFLREEFPNRQCYTVLGRGSYGVVIKAQYKGKPVAVKIVEKQRKHRCRYDSLRNESNMLNRKHGNIVRVLKIISGAQYGLVIMERFDGHCLQNILNQNYVITIYHQLMMVCDIINGLCFCHRHHIVHLDVKPQNVIVCLLKAGCQSGGSQCTHVRKYTCKLCDFGSSIVLNEFNLNEKSSHRGTIRYMAPELLRGMGNISEAADVYSLGITMWQLIERRDPYDSISSNEAVAYNVVKKKLRPDSVTAADIRQSPPVTIPQRNSALLQVPVFATRKNSDSLLELSRMNINQKGNSNTSLRSSIFISSSSPGDLRQSNVDCATAAVSDVLKQQGIDLLGSSSTTEQCLTELGTVALDAIFVPSVDVPLADQNYIRQEYRALYRKCWQHEAALRPTASVVRSTLHGVLERIVCCK